MSVRAIAFLLPQFHPVPENDGWWGDGFTEWTNVRPARPLFAGHYQPHVPAELGYYDLREPAVRQRMAALAARYGIYGFCYYHYWFSGRRLLEEPFASVAASGQPHFPFCLCWANEPWSRRWDGSNDDVLQPQTYSEADDAEHIEALLPALTDPRAIRVDGRPLFLVYRPGDLPDPVATTRTWRAAIRAQGLSDLYLVAVESDGAIDPRPIGFDASVRFQPDWRVLEDAPRLEVGPPSARVYEYRDVWPVLAEVPEVPWTRFPAVCPGWDNTPRRREGATMLHRANPRAYEHWLRVAIDDVRPRTPDERIVFINAWNEWGEGCHLEPDRRHGHAFLRATRRALADAATLFDNGPSLRHSSAYNPPQRQRVR
jgi:O-antigen biosynthesis protein